MPRASSPRAGGCVEVASSGLVPLEGHSGSFRRCGRAAAGFGRVAWGRARALGGLDVRPGRDRAQSDLPAPQGSVSRSVPPRPWPWGQVLRGRQRGAPSSLEGPILRETTGQAEPHCGARCPCGPRAGAARPCSLLIGEQAGLGLRWQPWPPWRPPTPSFPGVGPRDPCPAGLLALCRRCRMHPPAAGGPCLHLSELADS